MIQKPKGTYDLYGYQGKIMLQIDNTIRYVMEKYNFEYVRTPIFEASELFHRGIGEATDIVSKETYDFTDRQNRNMTLRPEGTAAVVRSLIENKWYARSNLPVKCWYTGPMFRYEQPQIGRNRELFQWGIEVFGSKNALTDVEVMSIPMLLFRVLGLSDVTLKINSLGDKEARERYKEALLAYFKPYYDELSKESQIRYEKNPLRILDSKNTHDKELVKKAPKLFDYLNESDQKKFLMIQDQLKNMNLPFVVEPTLVRGFDYYTGVVFEYEFKTDKLGNQNILGGGGRYDNLVESLDGPSVPAVGLGIGLDRLILALEINKIEIIDELDLDIYVIPVTSSEEAFAFELATILRENGFSADFDHMNRSLKNNLKQSDRLGAKYIIIIGEEEIKSKIVTIKNNASNEKEEFKVEIDNIIHFFDQKIGEKHE